MGMLDKFFRNLKRDQLGSSHIAKLLIPYKYRRRSAYKKMLQQDDAKQKFSEIYQKNFWGSTESISGAGSEVIYTQRLRDWLIKAVPKYQVEVIVDAPCGDFNWMKHVLPEVDVKYFGFDIVDSVIADNAANYSTDKIHFAVADICADQLPNCDLLIVRDCLFHLSFGDIDRFFRNLSTVDYKYLLTTTHIVDEAHKNTDIKTAHFRQIDLFASPFNFDYDAPLDRVSDYPDGAAKPRDMILVEKAKVPTFIKEPA